MRRSLPFLIIIAVLIVAVGAGLVLYRYRMEPEPTPATTPTPSPQPTATASTTSTVAVSPTVPITPVTPAASTPPVTPSVSTTPVAATAGPVFNYGKPGAEPMHVRGDPGAPAVLEEFGDFQCLPCSRIWPVLEKLEHDYDKRLVVVFRERPLKMHRFGMDAARAAEAAGLQGKFWEMYDALYRNRDVWTVSAYVGPYLNDYATELGLDLERFKADMEGEEVTRRIAADQDRAESLGVDRTPILYLNGEKIAVTEINEKGLRAAIEKVLGAAPSR